MTTNIRFETTVHDCTIIKLGGSYAVSLPIKKLEDAGFHLGMPVQVNLSFDMQRDTEPVIDYSEDLAEAKDYLRRFDGLTEDELDELCASLLDVDGVDKSKPIEEEKEEILIELKSWIRFAEKEMKDNEDSFNACVEEDAFDYDKSKDKTLGLN